MPDTGDRASTQLEGFKNTKMMVPRQTLTMSNGAPIWNKSNTLTVGKQGPALLQDIVLLDEMAHFDRERIPERVVHAKGTGAHGFFEVTNDITKYTKCCVFSSVGKKTPVFVRFSYIRGQHGTPDMYRDIRGFPIKFYTEEGNWDLVGNNAPMFFVRDPMHFPSLVHAQMRNPVTGLRDWNAHWDFFTLRQESVHHVMWFYSDRGIPDGYRHMDGFGAHTFKLVNAREEPVYCKFHWKTKQGNRWLSDAKAMEINGLDPDYATRDLYNAIANGEYPEWEMFIQVMTMEQAEQFPVNPFDLTKVWPHKEFPMIPVGRLVLNRSPINFFAEVEQAAFSPGRIIPGIEFSPDKMLAARAFSYPDTQFHRLGPNFMKLPINCPYRAKVNNYQIDGHMCSDENNDGTPTHYPNSFNGPEVAQDERTRELVWFTMGEVARHSFDPDDIWEQPRAFWEKVLDEPARRRLVQNISHTLCHTTPTIQQRAIAMFSKVHADFGRMLDEQMKPQQQKGQEEQPTEEKTMTKAGQAVRGVIEEGMKKMGLEP